MTNLIVNFHSSANAPKYDPQEVICEDMDWIELARSKFGVFRNCAMA